MKKVSHEHDEFDNENEDGMDPESKSLEIEKRWCKYRFSKEELAEIALKMSKAVKDAHALEDQKKAVMSDFKAQIDKAAAEANVNANHLQTGWEMRLIECEVIRDFKKKEIQYRRLDTEDIEEIKRMSSGDLQMELK